ncbi:sensor domain-containing diguanylate cyclase [Pseudoroseomonas cervicalis]|uniref:sensor domain-containing diguanylate cyclase n=1 Tax=Teichococcus cervicalis TaxID=204525 RepID=UPI0027D84715|nr:sensor domain-containing diguanylate cyclase [Pseudoroseomonas cervicalis]
MIDAAGRALTSEELRLILDAVPVPLSWATLPDGRIRFMNQAFRRCFGYAVEDFSGVEDWISRAYPREQDRDSARALWEVLWKARRSGHAMVEDIELELRCADGSSRTVLHRGIVLYDIGIGIATFDDITLRKQAEQAAWHFAHEDCLTGLPNRRQLKQRWEDSASRPGEGPAVLALLDLDDFKPVNDRYGHEAGDAVLRQVATRLRGLLRKEDLVCRLGGDEFALLMGPPSDTASAEAVCARLREAIRAPLPGLDGHRLDVSLGLVRVAPGRADFSQAYRAADAALYRAKRAGKGSWRWAETG